MWTSSKQQRVPTVSAHKHTHVLRVKEEDWQLVALVKCLLMTWSEPDSHLGSRSELFDWHKLWQEGSCGTPPELYHLVLSAQATSGRKRFVLHRPVLRFMLILPCYVATSEPPPPRNPHLKLSHLQPPVTSPMILTDTKTRTKNEFSVKIYSYD